MSIDKTSLSKELIDLVGIENIITDNEKLRNYGLDRFGNEHTPLMVIKPSAPLHFKRLNFILRRYKVDSITPRGNGLGINLGSFSEDLVIDLTLLNDKLEIDAERLIVTAQAGMPYLDIKKKLEEKGFRFPIEPILNGTLGGFIASGGYGYGSYKYGTVMNFLRNTTLILSNGKIIQTGTQNTPPYSCGYNLNSLICGSEGFFGIISEVIFEIIPNPSNSSNLLISFEIDTELSQKLTQLTNLSTIYNISLYKGILNKNSNTIDLLIRLEGAKSVIEQEYSSLKSFQVKIDSEAEKLWKSRIIDPSQIPDTSMIIESIIPLKGLSQFLKFWAAFDSPPVFGILLNASHVLLYVFLPKNISNARKNDISSEFLKKVNEIRAYPPTVGNSIKKFVESAYPNLDLLKQLKPIFDEVNRMKSRKLDY